MQLRCCELKAPVQITNIFPLFFQTGNTYRILEFTCCSDDRVTKPPPRVCDEKRCRGPNADGGYSCWGVEGDAGHFKCADEFKVVMTGEEADYDHEGTVLFAAATLL